jgi:hypothetical protein
LLELAKRQDTRRPCCSVPIAEAACVRPVQGALSNNKNPGEGGQES